MDIICTPSLATEQSIPSAVIWKKFYSRVLMWPTDFPLPEGYTSISLDNNRSFYYEPMTPFALEHDDCASWISWEIITTPSGRLIRALKVDSTRDDGEQPTSIASYRDLALFLRSEMQETNRQVHINIPTHSALFDLSHDVIRSKETIIHAIDTAKNDILNNLRTLHNGSLGTGPLLPTGERLQTVANATAMWKRINQLEPRMRKLEEEGEPRRAEKRPTSPVEEDGDRLRDVVNAISHAFKTPGTSAGRRRN